MPRIFSSRFGGLYLIAALALGVSFLLRTALLIATWPDLDLTAAAIGRIYAVGLLFDLTTYFYAMLPAAIYLTVAPAALLRSRFHRLLAMVIYTAVVLVLTFDVAAEWLFWDEFSSRFNFIAVDYLVYTREVIGNAIESYPMAAIMAAIVIATAVIVALSRKIVLAHCQADEPWRRRLAPAAVFLAAPLLATFCVDSSLAELSGNTYADELSKNGFHSFVAAFKNNSLDYGHFYLTADRSQTLARLRQMINPDPAAYLRPAVEDDLSRAVVSPGPPQRRNVVIVTIESLNADVLGVFGDTRQLTPNLDALAGQSLLFTQLYATGTRTVRGLEALTLSLPPTPGGSVVKDPRRGPLFSLPALLAGAGYETSFIYGGYGLFDHMNGFFATNGCRIVDRSEFKPEEITFANVWGVCDEDLYDMAIREADRAAAAGRPFFQFVLTTSNHRPYTYPPVIDIPSGSSRKGAIKYTDFAIGRFLEKARRAPWFANTVFLLVADHCASSAGRTDIPVNRYHIPLLIYAPGLVAPGRYEALCSQIDVAPTLLGLLNFSYTSRFLGVDVLRRQPQRALLGTYEKLALFDGRRLAVLDPRRSVRCYQVNADQSQTPIDPDQALIFDTVSYYQSASYLLSRDLFQP